VTSERRVAFDGPVELEPECELAEVCGWAAGDPRLDPDEVEVTGELELGALACLVVLIAWDVPLVDDVLMLAGGDAGGGFVETRRGVCRACDAEVAGRWNSVVAAGWGCDRRRARWRGIFPSRAR
jgi:hypothetical protein